MTVIDSSILHAFTTLPCLQDLYGIAINNNKNSVSKICKKNVQANMYANMTASKRLLLTEVPCTHLPPRTPKILRRHLSRHNSKKPTLHAVKNPRIPILQDFYGITMININNGLKICENILTQTCMQI